MKTTKKFKVFIDGEMKEIIFDDFKNYNVIVNKSNGFSHDYQVIEKFCFEEHFYKRICLFTGKEFSYSPTHLTTKNVTNFIQNTSVVTFS